MDLPDPWVIKSVIVVTVLALANAWLYVLSVRLDDGRPNQRRPARSGTGRARLVQVITRASG